MRPSLLILALSVALHASAQFAPPGALWTYDQEGGIYTMTVVGDTVLNGHTCSIITGSSYSICWQSQAYTYQSGDTVFWSDDQYLPEFFELYRWNAQPGQSWDVWSNGSVTVTYTVVSTGTTTVNGQTLRTLNVEATDTQMQWAQSSGVLIEQIGDTLFLFPWLAAFCDAMAPWPLRCYSDDDLGTFQRPGVTDCTPPPPATVFAPVGTTWTYSQHFAFGPDSALFVIESVGDTLIQGLSCSILEITSGANGCMPFHRYVAATGDSVLFWAASDSSFQTLFALNAGIGDSWTMRADYNSGWANTDSLTWTVTSIGTTTIDGLLLRTLGVTVQVSAGGATAPLSDGIITERLGPGPYLFPWIFAACDGEFNGPLRCYVDPDINWLNPQFPQCELSVGVSEFEKGNLFNLQPSLALVNGPIQVNGVPGTLEVLDASGRQILIRQTIGSLEFSLAQPGLFIIRLTTRTGQVAHQRLIVR